ncbi:Sodium/calcium exchanger protein [Ancylostoma duodenale]|uniref:Sodium/calcium exchanger protein n=1 Tax=Ancylostoma duodenale TaxID=51022 RepID=A0A0C2GCH4_9BILA|nr:Sodium/calcium exchanger protein [Ancylostoma duodenale]
MSVNAGDTANATFTDCILHGIAFPWKFIFCFVPPPSILGGWLCFVVGLAMIGLLTAIVGDLASIFGCMVGLKDAVTAITLVALGTSLPDTFASKIAAQNDDTADNAVGNVTGSNSVNVFLGLGLPWLIASIYWAAKGESFVVPAADLGFSVTVFMVCSVIFLVVLMLRRTSAVFGRAELGGPFGPKFASGVFFVLLWIAYVGLSIWNTYRN